MTDSINWSDSAEESDLEERSNCKLDNRRCTYCFKVLKSSSDIPEHLLRCEIAYKSSARLVTCKNGTKKFICDICCRTFKYLRFLAEHEKHHEPPGGFLCKYCDAKFCTAAEKGKHTEDKHKVFKCQICKSILQTAENYIEHIKTLHNGQNREYTSCSECGRLYSSPLILKYHQETNCGLNGRFKCDQCEKTFQTKGRLKTHKLTHTNEKNFCCIYCGQKFRRFMNLQSHEYKHTGKKPYQCNVCQKSFSHRASLSTHSTTHTGLKPYLCECCGSRFSCASNIIQHRKKRPDTCGLPEYCTKLAKACPIANLKNLNLLTTEAPIKIFKSIKVIKENENELKNLKKTENSIKKRLRRQNDINCYDCTDQVFKKNHLYVKHLQDYHKKSNDEIKELLVTTNLKCSLCGKLYKLAKNLEKHLETHYMNAADKNISNKTDTTVESCCDLENFQIFQNDFQSKVAIKSEIISEKYTESSPIESKIQFEIKPETLEDHANVIPHKISLHNKPLNIDTEQIKEKFIKSPSKDSEKQSNDFKLSIPNDTDPLENSSNENESLLINSKEDAIKLSCPECNDQIFAQKSSFIRHLRSRIHNKSDEEIEKILTNLNDDNSNYLTKNLRSHSQSIRSGEDFHNLKSSTEKLASGRKIIRCYKCVDEIFYFKSVYIRHLRSRHHNNSTEEIEKILNELNDKKFSQTETTESNRRQENEDSSKNEEDLNKSLKIRCLECNEYFSQKSSYIRHLRGRSHNKTEDEIVKLIENLDGTKSNLRCNICGKLYTLQYYLQKHLKAHDKDGVLPNKSEYLQQTIEYSLDGKKIIRCYKCTDQVFSQKCLYIRHLRGRHHNKSEEEIEKLLKVISGNEETNSKCKICGKIYSIPYYLKKHLKTHGIDATHKCKFCDEYFLNAIEVLTHTQSVHKDQLTCSICAKTFSDSDSFMRHNQFVHSNKEKQQFICIKCGKKTSSKRALSNHELSNCGENPIYRCEVCGKGLSTAGILKAHMMLHTNNFPYKCSFCKKGFRFNDKLKVHLRSHTGEKPFQCPYCDKAFGHSSTLYIHVSTHTGIKRYMCITCSDRFSCISGLKAHWRTHPKTCGADPNRTTKPQLFMGYRKGKLVNKKDILD